jgi:hypothetical protein
MGMRDVWYRQGRYDALRGYTGSDCAVPVLSMGEYYVDEYKKGYNGTDVVDQLLVRYCRFKSVFEKANVVLGEYPWV